MKVCVFLCAMAAASAAQDHAPLLELNLAESSDLFPGHDVAHNWTYPDHGGKDATQHTSGSWFGNFSDSSEPKARRCTAKSTDSSTCPKPTCKAWDWHDKGAAGLPSEGTLECKETYSLVNVDGNVGQGPFYTDDNDNPGVHAAPAGGSSYATHSTASTFSDVNWDLRSEWLITYGAVDRAGNEAEEAAFTMIMDDRVPPGEGQGKGCGSSKDATCRFKIPFSGDSASPDVIESVDNCRRFQEIHHADLHRFAYISTSTNTDDHKNKVGVDNANNFHQVQKIRTNKAGLLMIEDNYDGVDVEDTLQIKVTFPSTSHDNTTACKGVTDCCPQACVDAADCSCDTGNSCPTGFMEYTVKDISSNDKNVIIDTRCLGAYEIEYTVHDFAGMFGYEGNDNSASRTGYISVVDEEKPVIHVKAGAAASDANTNVDQDDTSQSYHLIHECGTPYNDADNFVDESSGYNIEAGAICRDDRDSWKGLDGDLTINQQGGDSGDGNCGTLAAAAVNSPYRNDRPRATWSPNPGNPQVLEFNDGVSAYDLTTETAGAMNGVICSQYSEDSSEEDIWGTVHQAGDPSSGFKGHGHFNQAKFKMCETQHNRKSAYSQPLGQNTITYSCVDAQSLAADQKTRKVRVVDTTAPDLGITTVGKEHINTYCDAEQGCGLHSFSASGAGTYNVSGTIHNTTELAWNERSFNEHYTIEHTAGYAPDEQFIELLLTEGYGFQCSDNCGTWTGPQDDSDSVYYPPRVTTKLTWHQGCTCPCTNTPTTTWNSNVPGTYVLRYTCTDAHNNEATKCRTIKNEDKFKPVLTILGADVMTLEATTSGNYVDDGATCHDTVDGPIPANVEVSGDVVKLANIGEYLVQYNCRDAAGNQAEPLTRKVIVRQSWGAVTAKLDLPTVHTRDELVGNEEKQLALRQAMAAKLGSHGVTTAAVKLEVYEWQGTDQHGSCTKIVGGRRRLSPTETQQGSIGLKFIVAVPDATVAGLAQNAISARNFACNLITEANTQLANIQTAQTAACNSVLTEQSCNDYTAVDCTWSGALCTLTSPSNPKHFTALTCDQQCEQVNSLPADQRLAQCQSKTTGCFFPEKNACCYSGGICRNFGCSCANTGFDGTTLQPEYNPIGVGCQNSVTCQIHGDNPVTWEAGFAYSDKGATCEDSIDGARTPDVSGVAGVDVDNTGTYYVTYKATNTQGTNNYAWDENCCATRRTVIVTDTLKPVIRLDLQGVEVGRSSGAATAWRNPYNGKVHENPAHLTANKTQFDPIDSSSTTDYSTYPHLGPNPTDVDPNPMTTKISTSATAAPSLMAERAAAAPSSWMIAAAGAAVAGIALLAHARKQSQIVISVPV